MRRVKSSLSVVLSLCVLMSMFSPMAALAQEEPDPSVLVFHGGGAVAEAALGAIEDLADDGGFAVEATTDAGSFTEAGLAEHRAVVFLPRSGNALDGGQRSALESFVTSGGGFVGVNTAAGAESDWGWYGSDLVGTRPASGPSTAATATVEQADALHPATRELPLEWEHSEIWLNFSPNPTGNVHTVLRVRERDYSGGTMGVDHSIAWCQNVEDGRSFYTGLGSTAGAYGEANLQDHLLGAIQWAAGLVRGDCEATINANYEAERLTQQNTPGQLDQVGELHGMSIADDGRVFYIGRGGGVPTITDWANPNVGLGAGTVHVWDPATEDITLAGTLEVFGNRGGSGTDRSEEGLVGIALDPDFLNNGWVYLHWTPHDKIDAPNREAVRQVSRFTLDHDSNQLDLDSEEVLIEWDVQIERCCHAGGDMKFDSQGNLYVATGDTNSSEFTGGYAGNHPGIVGSVGAGPHADARRTSGNTNDLNGKILRITPTDDGGYTIPDGNLFPPEEYEGEPALPEIFVMGTRNPSRIAIDMETDFLHVGVVGPDAGSPSTTWGPAKYDWFSVHTEAGNQGWPFCVGDRQPYRDRNAAGQALEWYDCENLVNDSPNNTGLTNIPPQNPQTLWYSPSGGGPQFPRNAEGIPSYVTNQQTFTQPYISGGSQAAMGGPIFRWEDGYADSDTSWPEYWHGKWFIGDFYAGNVRNAVVLDPDTVADGGAPTHAENLRGKIPTGGGSIQHIHGWEFGPDGALYVLDYGAGAWFSTSASTALWRVSYTGGPATPFPTGSATPDQGDAPLEVQFSSAGSGGVSVAWDFGDGTTSTEANPTHTYTTTGQYTATLTVTYADGEEAVVELDVTVGTPPEVSLDEPLEGGMFDWGDELPFDVDVTLEDGEVACEDVEVTSQTGGETLDEASGCDGLIGTGDGARLDSRASVSASYSIDGEGDDPGSSPGLSGSDQVGVLSKHLQAEQADGRSGVVTLSHDGAEDGRRISNIDEGDWLRFDDVNLSGIDTVIYRAASPTFGGIIELRTGDPEDGELVSSAEVGATEDADTYGIVSAAIDDPGGTNDLYVVFHGYEDNPGGSDLFHLDSLYFYGDGAADPESQFDVLFDGTEESYENWESVGAGNWVFDEEEGVVTTAPAGQGCCGLLWYPEQEYEDFVLKLEWRDDRPGAAFSNSGVFVRFPDTGSTTATTAINQGHEIQIYDGPTGESQKSGSIYNFASLNLDQANPTEKGTWNDYEIRVVNQVYTVVRDGVVINRFDNTSAARGLSGHFGLQWHDDQSVVSFRNVRIKEVVGPDGGFMSTPPSPIPPPPPTEPHPDSILNTVGITLEDNAPNATIRLVTSWAAELLPPAYSVTVPDLLAPDGPPLRMTDTSGVYPNVATSVGQTYEIPVPQRTGYDTVHVFGAGSDGQGVGTFTLNYSDGTSEEAGVHFPDWANPANMQAPTQEAFSGMAYRHRADGQGNISGQYRETLPGGLLMRLYHTPVEADPERTLESITLPANPSGNLAFQVFGLTFEQDGEYVAADLYRVPDNDPPTVEAAVSGGVGTATVTLFAEDELSGIDSVEYSLDGEEWSDYEGWILLDEVGTHEVSYRATDGNWNVSDSQAVEVEVTEATELEPEDGSVLDMIGITNNANRFSGQVENNGTSWRAETLPDAHSVTVTDRDNAEAVVPWRMTDTSGAYANTSRSNGQEYVLPEAARRSYDTVHVLNAASNGPRGGDFTLRYTDGSTDAVGLTGHDWANPAQLAPPSEEAYGALGAQRHINSGSGVQTLPSGLQMRVYRTPLPVDSAKTLESVTFAPKPGSWNANQNVIVMGLTMEADGNFFPADLYVNAEPSEPGGPGEPGEPGFPVCEPGDLSDFFDGSELNRDRWTNVVREGDGEVRVQDGQLLLPTNPGDLFATSDPLASNIVLQPVPDDVFQASARITIDATAEGQQAGIMLYGSDGDWLKIAYKRHGSGDDGLEVIRTYDGVIDLDFGQDVLFTDVPDTFDFRLESDGEVVWGEYSFDDGETWQSVGREHPLAGIDDPQIGLFALSSPSAPVIDAAFDHFVLFPDETAVCEDELTVSATLDPENPDGDNDWYVSDVTLTLEVDPADTPLAWRAQGDDEWISYTDPVTFSDDGSYDVEYLAGEEPDGEPGEPNEPGVVDVSVATAFDPADVEAVLGDTIVFTLTSGIHDAVIVDDDMDELGRSPIMMTVGETWEFEADESGSFYLYCSVHSNGDGVSTPEELSGQIGTVTVIDAGNGGGEGVTGSVSFQIDQTPPETSASLDGEQDGDAYVDEVSVTLDATDATSGVASTVYRIDDGDEQSYDGAFSVSGEGSYTVEFRSTDVAGNVEDWQSVDVTIVEDGGPIDPEAPSIDVALSPSEPDGPDGAYVSPVTVTLSSDDDDATLEWREAGDTDWVEYGSPVTFSEVGSYDLEARATNDAGSSEIATVSFTIVEDGGPGPEVPSIDVSLSPTSPDGENGWFVSPVTVTLSSDDGDATLEWRLVGTNDWITYTGPVTVDTDGEYEAEARATNDAGSSEIATVEFGIDQTPPETSATLDGAQDDGAYINGVELVLSANDATSGVAETHWRLQGDDEFEVYDGPVAFETEGEYEVEFRSADVAGNAEEWQSIGFEVVEDPDAPSITISLDPSAPDGDNDWYVSPVTITLSSDNDDATLQWRASGSDEWVTYTQPVEVGDDGEYELEARAVVDGSTSGIRNVSFQIDQTPPETSASLAGDQDGEVYLEEVSVTLDATDATSGVAATVYRIDGGDEQSYDGAFTVAGEGSYTVEFRSTDVAGNAEDWQSVSFQVVEDEDGGPIGPPPPPGVVCARHQDGNAFPDSPGSGHGAFIECLAALGIVEGYADGTYGPRDDVSREQLASYVVRAIELATGETLEAGGALFSDVGINSTHGEAIYKLRNAGIIRGYEDGTFRPRQSVSRDQTARYVVNAIEYVLGFELPTSGIRFPDVVHRQYETDIDKLASARVIQGFPDGTFGPREPVTRGQMARFVGNALEVLAAEGAYQGP